MSSRHYIGWRQCMATGRVLSESRNIQMGNHKTMESHNIQWRSGFSVIISPMSDVSNLILSIITDEDMIYRDIQNLGFCTVSQISYLFYHSWNFLVHNLPGAIVFDLVL